ncbi:DUF882 domain-containing protein [Rhizobium sp. TRM95796]|uniref:DUF882 domain-containing protein n=1 Tax=Rhizobium sp. TRM95796 TaxID=2979862 RepID=UPI0021E771A0|nr:DUF882 domain-containing protein [Rhizobium sp. TRM95796]MCV3766108.1 DUF882 domain-containing protein [Rhizobium sp. TRM95796]
MHHEVETKSRAAGAVRRIAKAVGAARVGLRAVIPAILFAFVALQGEPASAAQTRALKIYHVHSREKAIIVFKRNGRYDAAGLKKLNNILRDWRRNEPTRMDPRLFDLIWEVYQKSGSRDYINVIGGYRAPETNAMLRSRTKGVAERSQHVLGKAMDFYIPDVSLRKLREIGMKFQVGGVGFYPTSGSPFVHMDVGGVRSWPRMPRRELSRLFPDGRTLHKPAEGGVMPGYASALADYKRRVGSDAILVAGGGSNNSDRDTTKRKSLLAALFGGGDEDESDIADAEVQVAAAPAKKSKPETQQAVLTAAIEPEDKPINAPVPSLRPAEPVQPAIETALLSTRRNPAEEAMQAALTPKPEDQPEFIDLAKVHVPAPSLLGERKQPGDGQGETQPAMMTASLDPATAALLTSVPVPGARPGEQQADAGKDDEITIPAGDVKPEEIAALAAQSSAIPSTESTDEDEVAGIIDSIDEPARGQEKLAELASLDVTPETATRSFEPAASQAAKPVAKPLQKNQVEKKTSGPELTGNMIAKWALSKGRVADVTKPVKAPRFVSKTMRVQPTEIYADGFTQSARIDPARFSGSAVNFIPVKKFPDMN